MFENIDMSLILGAGVIIVLLAAVAALVLRRALALRPFSSVEAGEPEKASTPMVLVDIEIDRRQRVQSFVRDLTETY